MRIVISSGHGKYIRGSSGYLDEVNEARRVVEQVADYLRPVGVDVVTFHDDVSDNQSENLERIVDFHNSKSRELDVSVHFNAYETTSKPMGTECLFVSDANKPLAARVSAAIAEEADLPDRGAKKRTDLYFLNNTTAPAILIETVFVDSSADAAQYQSQFDSICAAIAQELSGETIVVRPPGEPVRPEDLPPLNPRDEPIEDRPVISEGDYGPDVYDLQRLLPRFPDDGQDGDFGPMTQEAVINYQRSRGLDVDGIVGPQTWEALYERDLPQRSYLPLPLSEERILRIREIASESAVSDCEWKDRGVAPEGYVEGFALAWANTYRQFRAGYPPAVDMAKGASGDPDTDVLDWYAEEFRILGMNVSRDGVNTLRHLWALLMGLGMRESSGEHCCGRDMSADNTTSDTAEAGLFQTSYNAHNGSSHFDTLFADYNAGNGDHPQGFGDVFSSDVECSDDDWDNYGSGNGERFQWMCKHWPTFACATCATTLRHLRQHYGPINRKEAELTADANVLLLQVQRYVDSREAQSHARRRP